MYYQNYEDYMRSVLGYPIDNSNIYTYDAYNERNYTNYEEMESLYPEIYRKINPLVCKECDGYTGPITKETVESMVDRIYSNIEMNNDIMININVDNRSVQDKTRTNTKEIDNRNNNRELRVVEAENRQRRPNNPLLRDLIRILILNRLFGGSFPGRPQRPPRPPFPEPGRPPVRPPFPGPIQPYL